MSLIIYLIKKAGKVEDLRLDIKKGVIEHYPLIKPEIC